VLPLARGRARSCGAAPLTRPAVETGEAAPGLDEVLKGVAEVKERWCSAGRPKRAQWVAKSNNLSAAAA